MEQARLIRSGFLFSTFAALTGMAAFQESPGETIMRSPLDDLSPGEPSLHSLLKEALEYDFRGCDRSGNLVEDFWTFDVQGLYSAMATPETSQRDFSVSLDTLSEAEADARPNDRAG
jgi:hypothetical protein